MANTLSLSLCLIHESNNSKVICSSSSYISSYEIIVISCIIIKIEDYVNSESR